MQRERTRERGVRQRERVLRATAGRLRLEAVAAIAVLRVHHAYKRYYSYIDFQSDRCV